MRSRQPWKPWRAHIPPCHEVAPARDASRQGRQHTTGDRRSRRARRRDFLGDLVGAPRTACPVSREMMTPGRGGDGRGPRCAVRRVCRRRRGRQGGGAVGEEAWEGSVGGHTAQERCLGWCVHPARWCRAVLHRWLRARTGAGDGPDRGAGTGLTSPGPSRRAQEFASHASTGVSHDRTAVVGSPIRR